MFLYNFYKIRGSAILIVCSVDCEYTTGVLKHYDANSALSPNAHEHLIELQAVKCLGQTEK